MSRLTLFDANTPVIAKTYMGPLPGQTVVPGMKGVIIEREEITRRHKVRFENGRELWATADQIILDPIVETKIKPSGE